MIRKEPGFGKIKVKGWHWKMHKAIEVSLNYPMDAWERGTDKISVPLQTIKGSTEGHPFQKKLSVTEFTFS